MFRWIGSQNSESYINKHEGLIVDEKSLELKMSTFLVLSLSDLIRVSKF
jgi:hypothetical protein